MVSSYPTKPNQFQLSGFEQCVNAAITELEKYRKEIDYLFYFIRLFLVKDKLYNLLDLVKIFIFYFSWIVQKQICYVRWRYLVNGSNWPRVGLTASKGFLDAGCLKSFDIFEKQFYFSFTSFSVNKFKDVFGNLIHGIFALSMWQMTFWVFESSKNVYWYYPHWVNMFIIFWLL